MGIPTAQAAQPISQQQPAPQGKGSAQAGMPNVEQPTFQTQVLPGEESTTGGVPNQAGSRQTFNDAMGKGNQQPRFQQQQQFLRPEPPQQPTGKSGGQPNEFTMSNTTNAATSGQPMMGRRNPYSNTIQPWDNASIQPQTQSGKGKGY
jgi:hypothetical protein